MMKTGVFALGALSLINVAAAQPSGHHRRHQQLHQQKRQEVDVVYETDYSYVTTQLPDVVVYVDENGAPYSTSTAGQTAAVNAVAQTPAANVAAVETSTPVYTEATQAAYTAASSSTTFQSVYVAPSSSSTTSTSIYVAPTSSAAATYAEASSTSATSSAASSSSSASGHGPSGYGISYSPYNDDGTCKDQDSVNSDFATMNSYATSNGEDWSFVRIYGTDCSQVSTVLSASKDYGLQIFAGVYDISSDQTLDDELNIIIEAANGDWSSFQTIAIGNEVVNDGTLSVSEVGDRVSYARSKLTGANYYGNIVAVDTLVAVVANSGLCQYSDYVAVNSHPFFDGSVAAVGAGPWLLTQMETVSALCGGKDTWITETGWPTQGSNNNLAIPSTDNQKTALASIKSAISSKVIFLSAFNDMWKSNSASTYNAEQYWGICN